MITLGDVSVYSTYTYVNQMLAQKGYETEIVPESRHFAAGRPKRRSVWQRAMKASALFHR